MVEFMIGPQPVPSNHFPTIIKFLWLFACFIAIHDLVESTTSIAFNCERALINKDENLTSFYHENYAYAFGLSSHVTVYTKLIHELRLNDVAFAHDLLGKKSLNVVFVKHQAEIYNVTCPKETVTIIKTSKCFANGIKQIINSEGVFTFMDSNQFIVAHATVVECENGNINHILLNKLRDLNIVMQGSESVSFALYKSNENFDFTELVNQNATTKLLVMEEKIFANDNSTEGTLWTQAMLLYRKHNFKVQIAFYTFRIGLDIVLLLAGISNGLPFWKSLSLASSTVKKVIDFHSYVSQNKLIAEAKIMKFHREKLGCDPNSDLSKVTATHLNCIYESLMDLTQRCSDIETVLNSMARTPESSSSSSLATPIATIASARKRRSESPSPGSTPSLCRSPLPQKKRIKFTKSGAVYRTK